MNIIVEFGSTEDHAAYKFHIKPLVVDQPPPVMWTKAQREMVSAALRTAADIVSPLPDQPPVIVTHCGGCDC